MARLRRLLFSLFVLIGPATAHAQRRMVAEGLPTGADALYVSTGPTARVYFSTRAYGGGISSVGQFTSSNTVLSDTATGNKIVLYSTGSVTALSFVGDGSLLTNLNTGAVAQSSKTYNLTGSTSEPNEFKVCFATGTITASGTRPIQVSYSGSITASGAAGHYCVVNFLQDGAFISPYTYTVGMGAAVTVSAGGFGNGTTVRVFPAPSAGEHSWCISMRAPFGDTCTFSYGSSHGNEFSVTEL